MPQKNADGTPFKPGQLFDPLLNNNISNLTNTPGLSLSRTNTPAQLQAAGAITPESLASTDPLLVIDSKTPTTYDISGLEVPPDLKPTNKENEQSVEIEKLKGLNDSMIGKSAFQSEQETKFGVDTAQSNINDLSAQLTRIKNEAAAIPLQYQQNAAGQTTTILNNQTNAALRSNAIAALGVSTLLAASQGQLANAQAMADKAVGQKYDPIQEQIDARKANLDLIINDPKTSLEDKNRALKQKAIEDAKAAQVEKDKENSKTVQKIAIDAASNISNFTPTTEYQTATQALTAIQNEKDPIKATEIATRTGLFKVNTPASADEYEYAKSQGYTGSFMDYQKLKATQFGTEDGPGNTTITPANKTKLLGAGFNSSEISQIQSDINQVGLEAVLDDSDLPEDKRLTDSQKKALRDIYNTGESKLTRENLASLFDIPDNDEKTGFKGYFGAGKTNKEKLDEFVSAVEKYRAVGYSDDEILKLMK